MKYQLKYSIKNVSKMFDISIAFNFPDYENPEIKSREYFEIILPAELYHEWVRTLVDSDRIKMIMKKEDGNYRCLLTTSNMLREYIPFWKELLQDLSRDLYPQGSAKATTQLFHDLVQYYAKIQATPKHLIDASLTSAEEELLSQRAVAVSKAPSPAQEEILQLPEAIGSPDAQPPAVPPKRIWPYVLLGILAVVLFAAALWATGGLAGILPAITSFGGLSFGVKLGMALVCGAATFVSSVVLFARCCCSSSQPAHQYRSVELDDHAPADEEAPDPSKPSAVPDPHGRLKLLAGASDHLTHGIVAAIPPVRRLPGVTVPTNLSLQK